MKPNKHAILILAIFLFCIKTKAQKLAAVPYVSGINSPIDVKNCGDSRLFVVERGGTIRVIDSNGALLPTPFLNISSQISSTNSEEGFLGLAFSPDYQTSGKFYVDYTSHIAGQLTSIIQEYKVSTSNPNVADASTALTLLTQTQPFSNHNGGNLMFGKDGYLYINFGDGGSGGDPYRNGQNKKTFLAKILRVDVSQSSPSQPYMIPPTNPFYNDTTTGIKKEIWAYGVRNPWRSSVDRLTGDLWIADVGQDAVEEIDYQPFNAPGGRNYGWNIMEGKSCYSPFAGCNIAGLTMPVYTYPHPLGNSIIGGYMYRSAQSKSLFGTYIFADYVAKWVDGFRQPKDVHTDSIIHFISTAKSPGNPISFGEDKYGDEYIVFYGNGTVYKLEDTSALRRPKAYLLSTNKTGDTAYVLQGLEGRNLSYQWYKDNVAIPDATSASYTTSVAGKYNLEVTNALSFKDTSESFLLGSSISLLSFTAVKTSGGLSQLNWNTGAELNITGYTIQRRKNNETNFTDIDSVVSKAVNGFSNNELNYTFIDSAALPYVTLFYRLQIHHADGSITYSDVRFITSDITKNGFLFFPNPASSYVQIYLNNYTQPLLLLLYDNAGRKLKSQTINQQITTVTLPLSKGVYIIQVSNTDGKDKVRKKLLVL